MPRLDLYAVLEVSPKATDDEIKRAYRKLAFQFHPDVNQGEKKAEAKIREINAAYEILGNPETRKSYERLRFGGYGPIRDNYGEKTDETIPPSVILEKMEKTLWEEARRELFMSLMKDLARVKVELATIREMAVATLGYDKFQEALVKKRALEVVPSLVTAEMEVRKHQLLDVALQMMLSQGVVGGGGQEGSDWVSKQLANAYDRGRIDGFSEACGLLYARQ
ncbi:MAG: DnaJ domain-containing protein [Nitrospirota bacterium]|nr:DnaJ domain-containing protein [Nitrospirota bacterium]